MSLAKFRLRTLLSCFRQALWSSTLSTGCPTPSYRIRCPMQQPSFLPDKAFYQATTGEELSGSEIACWNP